MSTVRDFGEDAVWAPTDDQIKASNMYWLMRHIGVTNYADLHRWSIENRSDFWKLVVERLDIPFRQPFVRVLDTSDGVEHCQWMVGGKWNIVDSCFAGPANSLAIIHQSEHGPLETMTLGELRSRTGRIAAALRRAGIGTGDAVASIMPMTPTAVALYLATIQCGAIAVGIAESFSPPEIELRLRLGRAKLVVVSEVMQRGGKSLSLYDKLRSIDAPPAVVLPDNDDMSTTLRDGDTTWSEFLDSTETCEVIAREPDHPIGVLFSSGTTGEPKAIPWTNLCPIKCAADAHFHQDIKANDVLAWPTSMGWMMGPWLVFASLMNRSAMALYDGLPTTRRFTEFVERAGVTMLGVVPRLIAAWRKDEVLNAVDWSNIKVFSSTGECSNADDVRWLIEHTGGGPMIEYCGGTEIAGGYITGTVTRACVPATFNTPALGMDIVVVDDSGAPADRGELFLVPPSIGLSSILLNRDHHQEYYLECPRGPNGEILRRHGDEMECLPDGYWRAHGRVDDTMNLSGIKVSSVEIERVICGVDGVTEVAAVAELPAGGGISQLVVYAVVSADANQNRIRREMQSMLREQLNPLFKMERIEFVESLPRTASNKVIRRRLRGE